MAVGPESARNRLDAAFRASGPGARRRLRRLPHRPAPRRSITWASSSPRRADARGDPTSHSMAAEAFGALASEHADLPAGTANAPGRPPISASWRGPSTCWTTAERGSERLAASDAKVPRIRAGLARNLYAIGRLTPGDAGRALLHRALDEQEKLVREQPRNFDFRQDRERTLPP